MFTVIKLLVFFLGILLVFGGELPAQTVVPVEYFSGVVLDAPLRAEFSTGEELVLAGRLQDTEVTQILFRFNGLSTNNTLRFFLPVRNGRFEQSVLLSHDQADTYELDIFAGQEGESLSYFGSFSPIAVARGSGVISLPVNFVSGVRLDSPLPTRLSTGETLELAGVVEDAGLTQVLFSFSPGSGEDLDFFIDVVNGRFERIVIFDRTQADTYELKIYVGQTGESLPFLGESPLPIAVEPGSGEVHIPIDFFSGVTLDASLPGEMVVGQVFPFEGSVRDDITGLRIDLAALGGDEERSVEIGVERDGRFYLPFRLSSEETGAFTFKLIAELKEGSLQSQGEFILRGTDPPAPDMQVGVLAVGLLPGESVGVPIANLGEESLEIEAAGIIGPFEVEGVPGVLASGERGEIRVVYRGDGGDAGELTVAGNDPRQPEVKVALNGLQPAERGIDLMHLRAGADGVLTVDLDLAARDYALAVYAAGMAGQDTSSSFAFSVGGLLPAARSVVVQGRMSRRDEGEAFLRKRQRQFAALVRERGWRAPKRAQVDYRIGDRRELVFPDMDNISAQTVSATVVAVGERGVAFVQDDLKAHPDNIDAAQIREMIDQFSLDYPLVVETFGAASDVDGDGKVTFLFTHLVDDLEIGGFYSSSSVFPVEDGGTGNMMDLMFISPTQSFDFYRPLLVHEFQHLVNFNQHVLVRSGEAEVSWLDEGLAHVSEDLVGRGYLEGGNNGLVAAFLGDPSAVGLTGDAKVDSRKRGAAYLFVRSLVDRLGPGILLRLVGTGLAEQDNVETATGEKFEDLLALWAAQLYASGNGLIKHPRLNYSFPFLQAGGKRAFPMPAALAYESGGPAAGGMLRARGVNFVEISGQRMETVALNAGPEGEIGIVVIPVSKNFAAQVTIPPNYFGGLLLDQPLSATARVEEPFTLSGRLQDPELTQVLFSFSPEGGGEDVDFFIEVEGGVFSETVEFTVGQIGAYGLNVYAGMRLESLPWLDEFDRFTVEAGSQPNSPPQVASAIIAQTLRATNSPFTRDLDVAPAIFGDADGDPLTYSASSSNREVVTVDVAGSRLTVVPVSEGTATVTIAAEDGRGGSASTLFEITVSPSILPSEGTITMDFDLADGDQAQRSARGVKAGEVHTLQLNVIDAPAISGWSSLIEYDPTQVRYVSNSFQPGAFLPGLISLATEKEGTVNLGGTILGSGVQSDGDGSLGIFQFEILDSFADSTELIITEISFNRVDGVADSRQVHSVAILSEAGGSGGIAGDFDGNGQIDFSDFFLFADQFGKKVQPGNPYDLEPDGQIDFSDFFVFADQFGKNRSKLIALAHGLLGLPSMPVLLPNYPNPFNSDTLIPFQLSERERVQLHVFNLLGQRVRSLMDRTELPGVHRVAWDGRDDQGRQLTSGVYLYQLRAGDFVARHSMLLVR